MYLRKLKVQALSFGNRLRLIQCIEGVIKFIGNAHAGGETDQRTAARRRILVKPPFYVPLPDRVSGTGGRMFRA